jgi:hypothetical protein
VAHLLDELTLDVDDVDQRRVGFRDEVDRPDLKRAQRRLRTLARERADHDDRRPPMLDDPARRLESPDPRHLDVHGDDVWTEPFDHRDRLLAARRGPDDLDVALLFQQLLDRASHERGVVRHDDPDRARVHAGTAAFTR